MTADTNSHSEHLTLGQYLAQVQQAIRRTLPESCWVVAELTAFTRRPNGHCYLDLLESERGREIAKTRATLFAAAAGKVLGEWQRVTGGLPQAGMKVLLKVRADFSPQFGFSLNVTGIDPAYTLGDMQAKMQALIASLKERGWFDLQRQLPAPSGYWRVAVVAPHGAAGLADFRRDADRLAAAGVCAFEYFTATFQGREASDSIRGALRAVHARHQEAAFDVVCLIRGGGARADLAWLDEGNLAAWVCRLPIPVFTGLGHETDESLLDLVAHRRFDTPSKVIGHIRSSLAAEAVKLRAALERSESLIQRLVAGQTPLLDRAGARFSQTATGLLHRQQQRQATAGAQFASGSGQLIHLARLGLSEAAGAFFRLTLTLTEGERQKTRLAASCAASEAHALLARERNRLVLAGTLFDKTNPLALLERGFALVRGAGGEVIASARQAHEAGHLELTFADGKLVARADEASPHSVFLSQKASE